VHFPETEKVDLKSVLPGALLDFDTTYKCRVLYGKEIGQVIYEPYIPRNISQYHFAVCPSDLEYSFKFASRKFFDEAKKKLLANEDYIYVRNGLITDTSYANIVFCDNENYYTPAQPLLKGTKRAHYLSEGRIKEEEIRVKDLRKFSTFFIINAMLDIGDTPVFSCDKLLLSHIHLKL
jgi:4-amino-4-deoxychorismate lyase